MKIMHTLIKLICILIAFGCSAPITKNGRLDTNTRDGYKFDFIKQVSIKNIEDSVELSFKTQRKFASHGEFLITVNMLDGKSIVIKKQPIYSEQSFRAEFQDCYVRLDNVKLEKISSIVIGNIGFSELFNF